MVSDYITRLRSLLDACATKSEFIAKVEAVWPALVEVVAFAVNVRDNYDCDSDAHRYGTPCRACDANKVLEKLRASVEEGDA